MGVGGGKRMRKNTKPLVTTRFFINFKIQKRNCWAPHFGNSNFLTGEMMIRVENQRLYIWTLDIEKIIAIFSRNLVNCSSAKDKHFIVFGRDWWVPFRRVLWEISNQLSPFSFCGESLDLVQRTQTASTGSQFID